MDDPAEDRPEDPAEDVDRLPTDVRFLTSGHRWALDVGSQRGCTLRREVF